MRCGGASWAWESSCRRGASWPRAWASVARCCARRSNSCRRWACWKAAGVTAEAYSCAASRCPPTCSPTAPWTTPRSGRGAGGTADNRDQLSPAGVRAGGRRRPASACRTGGRPGGRDRRPTGVHRAGRALPPARGSDRAEPDVDGVPGRDLPRPGVGPHPLPHRLRLDGGRDRISATHPGGDPLRRPRESCGPQPTTTWPGSRSTSSGIACPDLPLQRLRFESGGHRLP